MAKLEIKIYGDPVLREKARPVEIITEAHRELARDMAETMYNSRGIGLAANQVGSTERIIVVDVTWADRDGKKAEPRNPTVMINPEVLDESPQDEVSSEGCLSLPEIEGEVWRPVSIKYRYQDLEGRTVEAEARDLEARCILHEVDHLDGVMFIDRMAAADRERLAGKLNKLRKTQKSGVV